MCQMLALCVYVIQKLFIFYANIGVFLIFFWSLFDLLIYIQLSCIVLFNIFYKHEDITSNYKILIIRFCKKKKFLIIQ